MQGGDNMDNPQSKSKRKVLNEEENNIEKVKHNGMKTVMSLHPMHCGGACMLKLHVKDGRVCKVTSAGDIPREGSYEKDEALMPMQRRACLMGISEKKRIFAPDRLK
jgi:anaerobic dimethyl sulfoxide reductase subunit A